MKRAAGNDGVRAANRINGVSLLPFIRVQRGAEVFIMGWMMTLLLGCWAADNAPTAASSNENTAITRCEVGPLRIEVECTPHLVGLADTFSLGVTLSAPEQVEFTWPALGANLDTCRLASARTEGPEIVKGEFAILRLGRWKARIEPGRLGELRQGKLLLRYREPEGTWQTAEIAVPPVTIVAGSTGAHRGADLMPAPSVTVVDWQRDLARACRWAGWTVLAVTLLGWCYTLRPRPLQPVELALTYLAKIESQPDDDCRRDVQRCTDIVRQYLQEVYHLGAPRQTTPELLHDPRTAEALPDHHSRLALAQFLQVADVEKFAARSPTTIERDECIQQARLLLLRERTALAPRRTQV